MKLKIKCGRGPECYIGQTFSGDWYYGPLKDWIYRRNYKTFLKAREGADEWKLRRDLELQRHRQNLDTRKRDIARELVEPFDKMKDII